MNRREFFDRHADGWDSQDTAPSRVGLHRVVREARLEPGSFVLDIGTGTGVLVPLILREIGGHGRLLALDISGEMLREARARLRAGNVLFVQADVHRLCARDATFDCVICNAAFPHFEDRALSLREMNRVLRRGGMLVISHPIGREAVNARHRAAGGPVGEDRVPPPEAMSRLLAASGIAKVAVIDEPEFYLARGRKRG